MARRSHRPRVQQRRLHTGPRRIAQDARRFVSYLSHGIAVIAFTNEQIRSVGDMDVVAREVARHLGLRMRLRDFTPKWRQRQASLRAELGLPTDEGPV